MNHDLLTADTISRKKFLAGLTLLGIELSMPSFISPKEYFLHGVASGDPLQNSVIVWTRISDSSITSGQVEWEIAENSSFSEGLRKGKYVVSAEKDYTLKVDIAGLQPGHRYFYRFKYKGIYSPAGVTKTLPAALNGKAFSMAVVACNNWEDGYFNAFRFLAKREEVDVVLHLGDYIYEYKTGEYGNPAVNRINSPLHEIITLNDYRQRYAQYRTDPDLQSLHAAKPFMLVWDDHEFANDAYMDGAANNQPGEADWTQRKNAAMQAYFEWLPVRANSAAEMHRKVSIGHDIDLFLADQRITGRTVQEANNAPDFYNADRAILGNTQLTWLLHEMEQSNASWQLIGNQVMFTGYTVSEGHKSPKYNDWWLGYPAERQKIIDFLKAREKRNTIFLTGDHHQSFVLALQPDELLQYKTSFAQPPLAWEFLTPSITSKNLDRLPAQEIEDTEKMLTTAAVNPHMVYADVKNHGYYIATINDRQFNAAYYFTDTVLSKETTEYKAASFTINRKDFLLKRDTES